MRLAGLSWLAAAETASAQGVQDLKRLSLDELTNLEVTTVSRSAETLGHTPAAVYVIITRHVFCFTDGWKIGKAITSSGEGTLGLTATSRKRLGERARGDLPREAPAVLAPPALTFLATIADDRVPVAVRLFLIVRRDLEGKRLAVLELRAAVETEARNAQNGELHREYIALLAARVVGGSGLIGALRRLRP